MIRLFWQQIPSPVITEIIRLMECVDGVVFDTEHGTWDNESLQQCLLESRGNGYVRMKENSQLAQTAVDNQCAGIIISNVKKDINLDIGVGLVRSNLWGESINRHNYKTIAQIESLKGIDYITISGLKYDYYMIGPYDLSDSLGCYGNFKCEKYQYAIDRFMAFVPPEKRAVHLVKDIEEQLPKYKDYGMVAFSLDTLAIVDKIKYLNEVIANV